MKFAPAFTLITVAVNAAYCVTDQDCASIAKEAVTTSVCCARIVYEKKGAQAVDRTCVSLSLLTKGGDFVY